MTSAAVPGLPGRAAAGPGPVRATTLRRLERSSGEVANAGVAAMAARLPWFARLTAEQRSGVLLVTQTGVANFVAWLREPDATLRLTAEAFRIAPLDLARRVTLRQTVELVRIAIEVFEERIPRLGADEAERPRCEHAVLRFGREVAFAAATVYASAAEARGAWDARLEALVVDAVVRGEADGDAALARVGAGLGPGRRDHCAWWASRPPRSRPSRCTRCGARPTAPGRRCWSGRTARKLVMIAGPGGAAGRAVGVVRAGPGRRRAHGRGARPRPTSARRARWPGSARSGRGRAPRGPWPPTTCCPSGRSTATPAPSSSCVASVAAPLREAGGELAATVECYLEGGGVLEAARPRALRAPQHRPLPAAAGGRGHRPHPGDARGALVLRLALVLDRCTPDASPV